jgi:hypothetical protein
VKGTFKDHIVEWVEEYIKDVHSNAEALRILVDIDQRYIICCNIICVISITYSGLRPHHHTLAFSIFMKEEDLSSGQEITPRLS